MKVFLIEIGSPRIVDGRLFGGPLPAGRPSSVGADSPLRRKKKANMTWA